ncbi:hypothetical protein [Enterobacter bugandensis]|uniref:hypothetical protein n=1 Tax=Enterobacter bugandensis TaxID=881260 RepID=UPI0022DEC391|nr:hypothetical protein [Enterobacter bugandensis]
MLPNTLNEVCDYLTTECGHQHLWLDWRAWPAGPRPPHLNKQPFVTSCSGRELAEYDGAKWCFINCTEFLYFNDVDDVAKPETIKYAYLTADDIDTHRMYSGL